MVFLLRFIFRLVSSSPSTIVHDKTAYGAVFRSCRQKQRCARRKTFFLDIVNLVTQRRDNTAEIVSSTTIGVVVDDEVPVFIKVDACACA